MGLKTGAVCSMRWHGMRSIQWTKIVADDNDSPTIHQPSRNKRTTFPISLRNQTGKKTYVRNQLEEIANEKKEGANEWMKRTHAHICTFAHSIDTYFNAPLCSWAVVGWMFIIEYKKACSSFGLRGTKRQRVSCTCDKDQFSRAHIRDPTFPSPCISCCFRFRSSGLCRLVELRIQQCVGCWRSRVIRVSLFSSQMRHLSVFFSFDICLPVDTSMMSGLLLFISKVRLFSSDNGTRSVRHASPCRLQFRWLYCALLFFAGVFTFSISLLTVIRAGVADWKRERGTLFSPE